MSKPARISYVIMAIVLLLIGWLHLGTLVLTVLFGYFALRQFSFGRSKLLGVVLYLVAVVADRLRVCSIFRTRLTNNCRKLPTRQFPPWWVMRKSKAWNFRSPIMPA